MKTLLLLTFLLVFLYRRFKSIISNSSLELDTDDDGDVEENVVPEKEKNTKVDYNKVRDADFEDLDE